MDGFRPLNPLNFRAWWTDPPAGYHGGGGTLSFADGHAEIHQWQDPRTIPPIPRPIGYETGGWLVPNNPDVYWLQFRATRLESR